MAMHIRDIDDPVWAYTLETRLLPYIPSIREWWTKIDNITTVETGVYPIDDGPPGLFFRFTRTAKRSPILGVQAFPFVNVGHLQLTGVTGGAMKMIARVCSGGRLIIDEFTCIEKHNLPSTFHSGQFIAFVPTTLYNATIKNGQWIFMTQEEMLAICKGHVPITVYNKAILKI